MEDDKQPPDRNENASLLATAMRYTSVVFEFIGIMLVLGFVGVFVDKKYGCSPWGLLGGIIAGVSLALYTLIKQLRKLER